jgi:hypothetical protein
MHIPYSRRDVEREYRDWMSLGSRLETVRDVEGGDAEGKY